MPSMFAFTCFFSTARVALRLFSSVPSGQKTELARDSTLGLVSKKVPSPEKAG